MFVNFTIHFAGPICKCETMKITWGIAEDRSLVVSCDLCKVKVAVPYTALWAKCDFEEPYPAKAKVEPPPPPKDKPENLNPDAPMFGKTTKGDA